MSPKKTKKRTRHQAVEQVAEDLEIELPKSRESLGLRVLAYGLLIGGFSLVASVFMSILEEGHTYVTTLARIGIGSLLVVTAFGILKQRLWSLAGLGALIALTAWTNLVFAAFFAVAFVYVWLHRTHFR